MNILIVGYGQIGRSIEGIYNINKEATTHLKGAKEAIEANNNILYINKDLKEASSSKEEAYNIFKVDAYNTLEGLKAPSANDKIDVMHICFGYTKEFVRQATEYIGKYKPTLTIIHSTVDIYTTRELIGATGKLIVHSPVMGRHPNLTESLFIFRKIIGGLDRKAIDMAKSHFNSLGIDVVVYRNCEESEAAKLLDTSYYGWNILYMKHVNKFCREKSLDFENVYTTTNEIYNEGYKKMGMKNVTRPILQYMPGKIGGHCVVPNFEILKNKFYPAKIGLEMNNDDTL